MPATGPIFRVFCDRHGLAALPVLTQTAAVYLKIPRDAAVLKSQIARLTAFRVVSQKPIV